MAGVRFLRELRRRHVFRVAAGYAVVDWLENLAGIAAKHSVVNILECGAARE